MTVKKICFKCGIEKPLIDFYKHSAMKDGYLNKCKECSKKDVSKNRIKNVDYYREYDRNRPNKTERIQQRKIYKEKMKKLEPEKFNEIFRVTSKRWSLKNKLKKTAHGKVHEALKKNILIKPEKCSQCGSNLPLQAHHYDYNKPLDVIWLCTRCHADEHNHLRELKRRTECS